MADSLMSEHRHNTLIKAAEETIGLMNIGVDGNAALAKVAEDKAMNDHEVDIVAHAVNNSKQLAHLQSSSPEDREKEFPLIDPDAVRSHAEQPVTNADNSTGTRYGAQESASHDAEERFHQPDAVDIHKDLSKAAAATYAPGDYRSRPDAPDYQAVLRADWGLTQDKVAGAQLRVIDGETREFQKLSAYQIGVSAAKLRYSDLTEQAAVALQKVAHRMRRTDRPSWTEVEKAAHKLGADTTTIDLAYAASGGEGFGHKRPDLTKVAAVITVKPDVREVAEEIVRADTFWKSAADAHAAGGELQRQHDVREAELCGLGKSAEFSGPESMVQGGNIPINPSDLSRNAATATDDFFSTPESLIGALGGEVDAKPRITSLQDGLSQKFRQSDSNLGARARLEGLMEDEYIGGHDLPEVIDAYNAALSVNPKFGDAELVSYMRQHLATQGAVPLDLQIRARSRSTKGDE